MRVCSQGRATDACPRPLWRPCRCGGGDAGLESPDAVAPQLITACGDPEGFDRTKYDFQPGVGRGAPVRRAAGQSRAPARCLPTHGLPISG